MSILFAIGEVHPPTPRCFKQCKLALKYMRFFQTIMRSLCLLRPRNPPLMNISKNRGYPLQIYKRQGRLRPKSQMMGSPLLNTKTSNSQPATTRGEAEAESSSEPKASSRSERQTNLLGSSWGTFHLLAGALVFLKSYFWVFMGSKGNRLEPKPQYCGVPFAFCVLAWSLRAGSQP